MTRSRLTIGSIGLCFPLFLSNCLALEQMSDEPETSTRTQTLECDPADLDCLPGGPLAWQECPDSPAQPPGNRIYRCAFDVEDSYGRSVAGVQAKMSVSYCGPNGSTLLETLSGTTDEAGRRTLSVTSRAANLINCSLSPSEPFEPGEPGIVARKEVVAMPSNTVVSLSTVIQPAPETGRSVSGGVAGQASMDLFQSGPYDKILLIPEHFDQEEFSSKPRDRKALWKQLSPFLKFLHATGWDVWLVQPHGTGENLHEQAAEFAQAIHVATGSYALQHGCGSGSASVWGFGTAGVVARLATARWEADAAWRANLGLAATLPVRLLGTGDSPNYGMHLNLDMQKALWTEAADKVHSESNLDSCAAVQLLRGRWDPVTESKTNENFLNFWVTGSQTSYYSAEDQSVHYCAAGPPLATLNASAGVPGWPATPVRVGYANSNATDTVKCYAESSLNLNAAGQDLCKYRSDLSSTTSLSPTAGQNWLKIAIDLLSDKYWTTEDKPEWSDLEPGSRSPIFLDGHAGRTSYVLPVWIDYYYHQRFPTTFIPYKSARGIVGPVGSNNYGTRTSPFDSFADLAYSGVADITPTLNGLFATTELGLSPPACTPIPFPQLNAP